MTNPGYIIVDATGWDTTAESTVTGLYNRIDAAYKTGKPVYISGADDGSDNIMSPIPAVVLPGSNSYFIGVAIGSFVLTNADVIAAQ